MTHRIIKVTPLENFVVAAVFQNGVEKYYDVKNLFDVLPQFLEVKNHNLFENVKVDVGSYGISWDDKLDLAAEEIWEEGVPTGIIHELDIKLCVGQKLLAARKSSGLTQRELSEKTNIYQADISNIERGFANPSIQTLQKLAEGMGMRLEVYFTRK